jgi:hypothetical protein
MSGEPGLATDTGELKIGDGVTPWNDLPAYPNQDEVAVMISELVNTAGSVTMAEFLAHIDSAAPHPVYDDGPSLVLLYENAKV